MKGTLLKSKTTPQARAREIETRVRAALKKYDSGAFLTDAEWLLVQYESGGRGCSTCKASRPR